MATTYVVKAGESWESIAGKLTGNQRQFLELAQANPNIYMLAPGMVINIPDVFPETPNVSVAPGSELAMAGYATSSEIEKWYASPNNVGRMPGAWSGMGGVAGTPAIGAANIPLVGRTAEGKQRGFVAPTKGGYKPGWQPATGYAPGAYTPAQQPRGVPKPLPVGQTAEGRQRQFYTGQPTPQTTQEALQRSGYRQPVPAERAYQGVLDWQRLMTGINPLQRSYETPVTATTAAAPGYSYTTPPANQPATQPTTPAATPQAGEPSEADMSAVYRGTATPEVEARVAQYFGVTTTTTAATAPAAPGGYYLYGNPYYGGGAGPEFAPKSEWGTLIFQNVSDYAETLASEPLRNSGLLNGLFNWRTGW